ncbi:hypothetical protein M569_14232 [Genlisea aurea]|uniref:VQ domain-containing protein n=1 Tax=Genlisea aurea TaxID=192259 RepID=S8C842_9LAMI|nr:hypothetical protein M569_14232 [Genlisea aurea]
MDSGNSGSTQSSSGGDEEYDSRAAADGIFMTARGATNPMFDPLTNYMQQIQYDSMNPTMAWTRPVIPVRSDPDGEMIRQRPPVGLIPSFQFQASATATAAESTKPIVAGQNLYQNPNQNGTRNPKKRSRASRRAPTTVLTTDTTNFKAMVQEFTGIPSPPFSTSSFMRNRFDLFGSRSAAVDGSVHAPQHLPPYLRRPFAQKLEPSAAAPFTTPPATNSNNNTAASSSSSPLINYQQLPLAQNPNPFNVQNPLLNSVLQQNPKFIFSSPSIPPSDGEIRIGSLDEFMLGLGHVNHAAMNLTDLPSLVNRVNECEFNGNYGANLLHGEKAPENIVGREGTVESSWICSSE